MDQDFQATLERARENLRVVPLASPTPRATTFDVRFDGGSFELHIYEVRENPERRLLGPIDQWETVELARFALSPIALARLLGNTQVAAATYESVMGRKLPTEQEINEGIAAVVAGQGRAAVPVPKKR